MAALEKELKTLKLSVNEIKSMVSNQNNKLTVHQSKLKEGIDTQDALVARIKSQQV